MSNCSLTTQSNEDRHQNLRTKIKAYGHVNINAFQNARETRRPVLFGCLQIIFYPNNATKQLPTDIFSHGVGNTISSNTNLVFEVVTCFTELRGK